MVTAIRQAKGVVPSEEAVGYLRDLLRIDTSNPPGNELPAAQYLAGVLQREGYRPVVIESVPGRANVVARYTGTGEAPPLLLYGHLDVVSAETGSWLHHPFSGELVNGDLWGRGALDMKGAVAQQLMVMLHLKRQRPRLLRDVIFASTAGEESGGQAGLGFLVDQHTDLVRAGAALGEGGGSTIRVGGRTFYDACIAEKGSCQLRLRARSLPGHGATPRPGSAVGVIARAAHRLSTALLPFRATPVAGTFFAAVSEALGMAPRQRALTEPNLARALQLLPDEFGNYLNSVTHDTAVPTVLRAGDQINIVPGEAEAWVDGRFLPGQTAEGFLDEIRQVVGPGCEIEPIEVTRAVHGNSDSLLYQSITSSIHRYDAGATVLPSMMSGSSDARHLARLGTRCVGFAPLRVPANFPAGRLIHGNDERIPVDGYLWGTQVLLDTVLDFCTA